MADSASQAKDAASQASAAAANAVKLWPMGGPKVEGKGQVQGRAMGPYIHPENLS